jgi:hypothetical protein
MRPDLNQAPQAQPQPTRKHYTTDAGCWRSFTTDLIYAAAYGPAGYVEQIKRRKHLSSKQEADAYERGRRLAEAMVRDYPCEDAPDGQRRLVRAQRADADPASRIRYSSAGLMPKAPLAGHELEVAERQRRSGITDEERQEQAAQVARMIA